MEDRRSLKISQLISKQLSDYFTVEYGQYCRTQLIKDTAFVQKKKITWKNNMANVTKHLWCVEQKGRQELLKSMLINIDFGHYVETRERKRKSIPGRATVWESV